MSNIGMHVDGQGVYLATICKKKNSVQIDKLEYVDHIKRQAGMVTTGLSIGDVMIRTIDVPLTKKRALSAAMPFQIDTHFPYPATELIVHSNVRSFDKTTSVVQLIAAHKDKIQAHISSPKGDSPWVSCDSIALLRYCQHFFPKVHSGIVAHMGDSETLLIAFEDRQMICATSIPIGQNHFIKAWKGKKSTQTLPEDLSLIFSTSSSSIQDLKTRYFKHLDRAIYYLKSKCKTVLHLYGIPLGHFCKYFGAQLLDLPVLERREEMAKAAFAVAIGLALDTALADEQTIQFRQGAFIAPVFLAKLGKQLCASLCLASCIAFLTLCITNKRLKNQEIALDYEIRSFIEELGKHQKLCPSEFFLPHEKLSCCIDYQINKLQKIVRDHSGFLPVHLPLPTVSEVLTHLSKHPSLQDVDIQSFQYKLESFPTLEAPYTPFKGKVECQLSIASPSQAKQIHDHLLSGSLLIDPEKLQWHRHHEGYHLSFYLKSRR